MTLLPGTTASLSFAACLLLFMANTANAGPTIIDGANGDNYGRPNAPGSPVALARENHCWSGASTKTASRALVTLRDDVSARIVKGDLFVQALVNTHVIAGKQSPEIYQVHGFCE